MPVDAAVELKDSIQGLGDVESRFDIECFLDAVAYANAEKRKRQIRIAGLLCYRAAEGKVDGSGSLFQRDNLPDR